MFLNKKKKEVPSYYIWLLLGIIVLGGIFYVWQKFDSRLPDDPKEAATKVLEKMQNLSSFRAQIVHDMQNQLTGQNDLSVVGEFDYETDGEYFGEITITGQEEILETSGVAPKYLSAYIDDVYYTRQEGENWIDHSQNSEYTPFLRVDPLSFLEFSLEKGDIAQEENEIIDDVEYLVYSFSYSEEVANEIVKPFTLLVTDIPDKAKIEGSIVVNKENNLLFSHRIAVVIDGVGGELLYTKYSNYGSASIPMLDGEVEVEEKPSAEEMQEQEAKVAETERNEKRQIDLLAIKAALEKLYETNGTYPEANERISLATGEGDVVDKLLTYLKEIPKDPEDPKYYYGYQCSGGEQYELSAIQEDSGKVKFIVLTQSSTFFEEKDNL